MAAVVCLSVCPLPGPKARIEVRSKPNIGLATGDVDHVALGRSE